MSAIGNIEKFTPGDDFESYIERIKLYFNVNAVDETKKVSIFITLMGGETYNILKKLIHPEHPTSKTFPQLEHILRKRFVPKANTMEKRLQFYTRKQNENENITEYSKELKLLAEASKFDTFLNEVLRDIFIVGLKNRYIQQKLIDTPKITFENAVSMAKPLEHNGEASTSHSEKKIYSPSNVHSDSNKYCYFCNKKGHSIRNCRLRNHQ